MGPYKIHGVLDFVMEDETPADWSEWISRQRWAYEQLRRWAGLNDPPTGEYPGRRP